MILADRGGTAADLAQRMTALGAQCTVVAPSTAVSAVERKTWRGVLQCRSLDASATPGLTLETLNDAQGVVCGTTLDLVKRLAENAGATPPQLWLVTRGAQPVGAANHGISMAQSTIVGHGAGHYRGTS